MVRLYGSMGSLSFFGDGASTTVEVDLAKPPVGYAFLGKLPVDVIASASGANLVSATLRGTVLVLEFDVPIPSYPASASVSFTLLFPPG